MTSDTSTPHGVARPKRHGKSRALASHHAPNRKEIAVSFIVLILSSYDERSRTEFAETHRIPKQISEEMFEYGYRKSNYGPDELVTDAHGNPISVVDAMLSG